MSINLLCRFVPGCQESKQCHSQVMYAMHQRLVEAVPAKCTVNSHLMPHVGLLVGSERLSMSQNVHAVLGAGQHDIHSVGRLQKAYRPIPT